MAYVTAYRHTKEEWLADAARRTADYILRELTDEQGGFYCGQGADSEGEEGKYYAFTPEEVKKVLGKYRSTPSIFIFKSGVLGFKLQ